MVAHDRRNGRGLYVKADGQRFGDSQTLKVCCDVKYDVVLTVKPPLQKLVKLVIGGEEVAQDSSKDGENSTDYQFSWLTSGFLPTKRGSRDEIVVIFKFENAEVTSKLQVKLYSPEKSSHITWGTEVRRMEFEVKGIEPLTRASPYQSLVPTSVSFK